MSRGRTRLKNGEAARSASPSSRSSSPAGASQDLRRLFAWFQNLGRLVVRYERFAEKLSGDATPGLLPYLVARFVRCPSKPREPLSREKGRSRQRDSTRGG